MKPFVIVGALTPLDTSVLPGRAPGNAPVPHAQARHRARKGRLALRMRRVGHRNDHGVVGDHHVQGRQAGACAFQHSGDAVARCTWMTFRLLHACAQMDHADLVRTATWPLKSRQFLNIHLDAMVPDRDRTACPFFLVADVTVRQPATYATPWRDWRWERTHAGRRHCGAAHVLDAPCVPPPPPRATRPSPPGAHAAAVRMTGRSVRCGWPSVEWCADAPKPPGKFSLCYPLSRKGVHQRTLGYGQCGVRVILHRIRPYSYALPMSALTYCNITVTVWLDHRNGYIRSRCSARCRRFHKSRGRYGSHPSLKQSRAATLVARMVA